MADTAKNGYIAQIGEHVWCELHGRRFTGHVDENAAGLFLRTDRGQSVVLTTSLWTVGTMEFNVMFLRPTVYCMWPA